MMDMLEQDILPDDAAEARLLAMTRDQYVVHGRTLIVLLVTRHYA